MKNQSTEFFRIFVVDDSPLILRMVKKSLEDAGFTVVTAQSGEEALELMTRFGLPHLALVDINMPPGMDGFEFCEAVHAFSDLPVIMLTAIDEEETIVQAIDQYAEDYITKPFHVGELVARVRRVLRRVGNFAYTLDPLTKVDKHLQVDFPGKQAVVNGETISLTPTEAKLLYILMRNAGRTVTSDFILQRLWPLEVAQEERLRVYVHRLRRKIETETNGPKYIVSERGVGYTFIAGMG
ncbi:MAG: response regulator transcription factor [Ardenticatenaceae bacterium]|nr:response regulator transcription factor [Anaerolineales bacterium]MCB8922935.1 response regulator transcription factor [Ardenticatenaceae bacterium]MCB8990329.1 response regulator transcription factor [Ardenticatenaceae bacterium]MCB9005222.1 response regulator transcription factor [Ardenticatenaceae bacterium]